MDILLIWFYKYIYRRDNIRVGVLFVEWPIQAQWYLHTNQNHRKILTKQSDRKREKKNNDPLTENITIIF